MPENEERSSKVFLSDGTRWSRSKRREGDQSTEIFPGGKKKGGRASGGQIITGSEEEGSTAVSCSAQDLEGGGGQGGEQEGLEIQGGGAGGQKDLLPALW